MRLIKIIPGEYYHVFLRGNNKQIIFHDTQDYVRFLFLILYTQSANSFSGNVSYYTRRYTKHRVFGITEETLSKITGGREVILANFALMSNHFHLTVHEKDSGGIARYMQRILNAYTKYYNTRYDKKGIFLRDHINIVMWKTIINLRSSRHIFTVTLESCAGGEGENTHIHGQVFKITQSTTGGGNF